MSIYGYFVTWSDRNDGASHKDYGFVAAESRAEAVGTVEEQYETSWASVEEIGISSFNDDEDNAVIDQNQIEFFIDAMKQNGYEGD